MCTHPHSVYPAGESDIAADGVWPRSKSELSWCMSLTGGLFVVLALAAALGRVPYLGALLSGVAVVLQLWGPILRADHTGRPTASLGLNLRQWREQLGSTAALALVLLPLWALALHLAPGAALPWHVAQASNTHDSLAPWRWAQDGLNQLLGVALPEEVFWRGYVQPVLEAQAPTGRARRLTVGNGGTLVATALFALGHVVGGAGLLSLGTFFPGLVFAALKNRHRSVFASVLLHACCNLSAKFMLGPG